MAPALFQGFPVKRQNLNTGNNNNSDYCEFYDCSSTWNNWGRWVALAVIVVVVVLIAFSLSCFNSRRRRRRGAQPMYGTGWMAAPKYGEPYHGGPPAPPYSPQVENQQTGNTFNSNEGYYANHGNGYGAQQNGIELQQPQSAYQPQRGGDPVYDAPTGPPPGKKDYVVR